jgi:flagellar hook-associated protein 2
MSVVEVGRSRARIVAAASAGELVLTHGEYGSGAGFTVSYATGGTSGSASLGLAAQAYAGVDVSGTIGGYSATGVGQLLTGADDTPVHGLLVRYGGVTVGAAGAVTFSQGMGSLMESITESLLGDDDGSIQGILDRVDTQKKRIDGRREAFDERMQLRADTLIRKFTALEEAMALAQQQLSWIQAQLGSLVPTSSSR